MLPHAPLPSAGAARIPSPPTASSPRTTEPQALLSYHAVAGFHRPLLRAAAAFKNGLYLGL